MGTGPSRGFHGGEQCVEVRIGLLQDKEEKNITSQLTTAISPQLTETFLDTQFHANSLDPETCV